MDFERESLYKVSKRDFLVDLNQSEQLITVEKASKQLADLLNISEGTNLVMQEGLIFNEEEQPVEYSISFMKMNRFQYSNL